MRHFKILLILLLSFKNVSSQKTSKTDCETQQKIFSNFPSIINNDAAFNLALGQLQNLKKEYQKFNSICPDIKNIQGLLKNTIVYAEKYKDLKTQLMLKMQFVTVADLLKNYQDVIEVGTELLTHENKLSPEEFNNNLTMLQVSFIKLEAYNEVIKLSPRRKKYSYLDKTKSTNVNIANDLAIAYYKTKNYNAAIRTFSLCRDLNRVKKNRQLFVSSMTNNIGLCYLKLRDYKKAKQYFNQAFKELDINEINNKSDKGNSYNVFFGAVIKSNIAKIDIINKKYAQASKAYKNLIAKTKINGEINNIPESYLNLAQICFATNDIKKTEIYLDSTKNNYFKLIGTDFKLDYYNTRAKIALLNKNVNLANTFFEKFETTSDSIASVQVKRENILAQAKYNFDEKDKELLLANNNLKNEEKIGYLQKIGFISALILLAIIGFLLYKTIKNKKTIEHQNLKLTKSLTEKETLLKELHHRVKNNLQVISGLIQLKAKKIKSPEMVALVSDTEQHINSMALVHEMLYLHDDFEMIVMQDYLNKLTQQILQNFQNSKITTKIEAQNIFLPLKFAIPIGLVVSELMTNSNKYAFDEQIGIIGVNLYLNKENSITFSYQDNGKGLPENVTENLKNTMGLRLVQMLAEEMNGIVSLQNNNGFNAILTFEI